MKQASEQYLLEKYRFKCLKQIIQEGFKCFYMLHNLQEYSAGGEEAKPVSLTTLNGISSLLCRGKPGQVIADLNKVCTLQLSVLVLLFPLQN